MLSQQYSAMFHTQHTENGATQHMLCFAFLCQEAMTLGAYWSEHESKKYENCHRAEVDMDNGH